MAGRWLRGVVILAVVGYVAWASGLAGGLVTRTRSGELPPGEFIALPGAGGAPATSSESAERITTSAPAGPGQASPGQDQRPPLLLVGSAMATSGAPVPVSAQGLAANEEVTFTLALDSVEGQDRQARRIGSTRADKEGQVAGYSFTMPADLPPARYVLVARGGASRIQLTARLALAAAAPYAEPSTYSGKPGESVAFKGGGFSPRERLRVHFDTLETDPVAVVSADELGHVVVEQVAVPLAAPGEHAFVLLGEQGASPVRVPFSVLGFHPWLQLSTYTPHPDQLVGIGGREFLPGETIRLHLRSASAAPFAVVRADERGTFEAADVLRVPVDAVGAQTIIAIGTSSQATTSAELRVAEAAPTIELTTYYGQPGTLVAFTGAGFGGEERVRVLMGRSGGGRELASLTTGRDGTFREAGGFRVPFEIAPGPVDLTLVGERSKATGTVTYTVAPFIPWLHLSAYVGPPGSVVEIRGGGFAPGEQVGLRVGDGRENVAAGVVGDDGALVQPVRYIVPDNASGQLRLRIVGLLSRGEAGESFKVESVPTGGDEERKQ